MFKLKNSYELAVLLRKVQWNARAMFAVYTAIIVVGAAGAAMLLTRTEGPLLFLVLFAPIGMALLFIAPFLLYDYYRHKRDAYSLFTLLKQDLWEEQLYDERIAAAKDLGPRLAVSRQYLFSLISTFYIPLALPLREVQRIYFKMSWRRNVKVPLYHILYVQMRNGQLYKLPLGAKAVLGPQPENGDISLHVWVLQQIQRANPAVLVGEE